MPAALAHGTSIRRVTVFMCRWRSLPVSRCGPTPTACRLCTITDRASTLFSRSPCLSSLQLASHTGRWHSCLLSSFLHSANGKPRSGTPHRATGRSCSSDPTCVYNFSSLCLCAASCEIVQQVNLDTLRLFL